MIYFLHIPKTAGSSLRQIIEANYSPEELEVIGVHWTTWMTAKDVHQRIEGKPDIKAVHGHFSYGVHRQIGGEARYVTFLRTPRDRVISGYFHLRRHPKNPLRAAVEELSLKEYLDSGLVPDVDNGMVRRLSGVMDTVPYGNIGPTHLEAALEHMQRDFIFVGTLEQFDPSIYLLGRELSWKRRHYSKERQGTNRKGYEPSPETARRIDELTSYDRHLYDAAVQRLDEMIARSDFNPQRFHRINRMYNMAQAPKRAGRKTRRKIRAVHRRLFGSS
jgi:hypothetical protein